MRKKWAVGFNYLNRQVLKIKEDKLKILIIATTKFDLDGITNVILNYYRAIDKSNLKFDFIVPNELRDGLQNELKTNGSNVFKIEKRVKNPLSYTIKLFKVIKKNNYKIVHAHGNSSTLALEMIASKLAGVKVRIAHSHSSTCEYKIAHLLLKIPFKIFTTHKFACGRKAGKWLYNKSDFQIINNGIIVDQYKYNERTRATYREKLNLKSERLIGHVGNFYSPKNHIFLIEIFYELFKLDKNYRLVLIGDGKLRPEIENKVKEMGLQKFVYFIGKSFDVANWMQAMDIVVMPSKFEGLPLTLIEAQTAALRCFVSDKVSREVSITDLINFIPLESSPRKWATEINEYNPEMRISNKEKTLGQVTEAGFNIYENAKLVKENYLSSYQNE